MLGMTGTYKTRVSRSHLSTLMAGAYTCWEKPVHIATYTHILYNMAAERTRVERVCPLAQMTKRWAAWLQKSNLPGSLRFISDNYDLPEIRRINRLSQHVWVLSKVLQKLDIWTSIFPWQQGKLHLLRRIVCYDQKLHNRYWVGLFLTLH